MPCNEEEINDIIRGWVVVNTNNLDDKVIFKSDGMPTYHLANVVDDHLMEDISRDEGKSGFLQPPCMFCFISFWDGIGHNLLTYH